MAEFTSYEPGTPSWVDLGSTDHEASRAFYTTLFGWRIRELGPEFGGYAFFTLRDKMVAGVGPTEEEETSWTTCIAVADADDVAIRAEKAGGTVVRAPFDVEDFGRMAMLADPSGVVFAAWQYRSGKGAEIVNEPVSLSWNELRTRDPDQAREFYSDVLGWQTESQPVGEDEYTVIKVGGRGVAGMVSMGDLFPPDVPPHWLTFFAVDDADAIAEKARDMGGRVQSPPIDVPTVGRVAMLSGPHGEAFGVIRNV